MVACIVHVFHRCPAQIGEGERGDVVYLIDFGLATLLHENKDGEFEQTVGLFQKAVGTRTFWSTRLHQGAAQSYRDDLEARACTRTQPVQIHPAAAHACMKCSPLHPPHIAACTQPHTPAHITTRHTQRVPPHVAPACTCMPAHACIRAHARMRARTTHRNAPHRNASHRTTGSCVLPDLLPARRAAVVTDHAAKESRGDEA